ncbi:hypothetical protein QWI30_30895 [Citrobacter freundii]|nr:hypothetical protein [Citrobacter freundii]
MSSLEGLAGFMRSNPGAEGFRNRLGAAASRCQRKDAVIRGHLYWCWAKSSTTPVLPREDNTREMLGIDENTLMAMRRGMNELYRRLPVDAAKDGVQC